MKSDASYHSYRPYDMLEPLEKAKAAAEYKDLNCHQDYPESQLTFCWVFVETLVMLQVTEKDSYQRLVQLSPQVGEEER